MESRKENAAERKRSGKYNCAQAVACTFCDHAGVSEEQMYDIAGAFGRGMGSMDGTCGALIGAGIVIGMHNRDRMASMTDMKRIMDSFKSRNGAVTCRALKGVDSNQPLRACNDCVADAAEFLERILDGDSI